MYNAFSINNLNRIDNILEIYIYCIDSDLTVFNSIYKHEKYIYFVK